MEIHIEEKITLDSLIKKMIQTCGDDFKNLLLDDNGLLHKFILLAINGNQILHSNQKEILIYSGDQISFIPAIAGG